MHSNPVPLFARIPIPTRRGSLFDRPDGVPEEFEVEAAFDESDIEDLRRQAETGGIDIVDLSDA